MDNYTITPIGYVRSTLANPADARLQGDESSQEAWLVLNPNVALGLQGVVEGDALIVLTWLHLAQRDVLQVHPRGSLERPITGVFATRSQDRPNPIGLHQVTVLQIAGHELKVAPLEAVDGTPIVDIKPVLKSLNQR